MVNSSFDQVCHAVDARGAGMQKMGFCPAHKDTKPSLSIGVGKGDKVLVHCQAGCSFENVRSAFTAGGINLNGSIQAGSISPALKKKTTHPTKDKAIKAALWSCHKQDAEASVEQVYHYGDEISVIRFSNKEFRPIHSHEGGWVVGKPKQYPLYRSDEFSASGPDTFIFFTEGEKDCDNLIKAGQAATTIAGGANGIPANLRTADLRLLENRDVVLLPDNDDAGRSCMKAVADILVPIARSIRILTIPTLPNNGDITDWLHLGGEPEKLVHLAEECEALASDLTSKQLVSSHTPGRRNTKAPVLLDLHKIEPERVQWLWKNVLPSRKVTLIAGDPGLGKSTVTVDIAARISKGKGFPGDASKRDPGGVILLSAEDDPADTIRPRLDAMGGDASHIKILQAIRHRNLSTGDQNETHFSLSTDVDALEQAIVEIGNCRMIVIDPISAYMGSTDSHNNTEVRTLLQPLSEMAQEHSVAILCITHLNKGVGRNVIQRAMGSTAFTAAARSYYVIMKDPNSPDRRLLLPGKSNLGPDGSGWAYSLEDRGGVAVVCWEPEPVHVSADDLMQSGRTHSPLLDGAALFLTELLANHPMTASQVKQQAEEAGYSWRTVERAKEAAGVESKKVKGGWQWILQDRQDKGCP